VHAAEWHADKNGPAGRWFARRRLNIDRPHLLRQVCAKFCCESRETVDLETHIAAIGRRARWLNSPRMLGARERIDAGQRTRRTGTS